MSLSPVTAQTPSQAQYFTWINNTNEGATAAQTAVNLAFFAWLRREYGLQLDLYAFDAGCIDGAGFYGSTTSERFRRQFPDGFGPLAAAAAALGCRLGVWGGPDGFGETPAAAAARIEQMVALCRDHGFALFKFDAVCGGLRPAQQEHFVAMMRACREAVPDLILLNHRLELGAGIEYATTWLWEGAETYIDVHQANSAPGLHHRLCALERGLPPELARLTEDHGVCLSSCLDGWTDELVLQAFNRALILAPQLYGNPWLLRDDEFPRLARLFNLHRRWRHLLVAGLVLPEAPYGPHAVSRGDGRTRLITLRNLGWEPVAVLLTVDATLGLEPAPRWEVRRLHPRERFLGEVAWAGAVEVEIPPQRALLLHVSSQPYDEVDVRGVDYEVVRAVAGRPVQVLLHGAPGSQATIDLPHVAQATLDDAPVTPTRLGVDFAGPAAGAAWHRYLGELAPVAVPADAEALYEATCFAADNNALEVRSLLRSGPTAEPAVAAARAAFFEQPLLRARGLWDRFLFDDDPATSFDTSRRWGEQRVRGGAFRLDFGAPTWIDHLTLEIADDYELQPLKSQEAVRGSVSADLRTWRQITLFAHPAISGPLPADQPWRYLRLHGSPDRVRAVRGSWRGEPLARSTWRASNLFAPAGALRPAAAWQLTVSVADPAPAAYLAIAAHGRYGREGVQVAARLASGYRGCPDRSPSFTANTWECPVRAVDGNYCYYLPLTPDLAGQPLELVALAGFGADPAAVRVEAWLSAPEPPSATRRLSFAIPSGDQAGSLGAT